jgi:hypothetical protein
MLITGQMWRVPPDPMVSVREYVWRHRLLLTEAEIQGAAVRVHTAAWGRPQNESMAAYTRLPVHHVERELGALLGRKGR